MFLIFLGNKVETSILYKTHYCKTDMENTVRSQWGVESIVAGQDPRSKGVAILLKTTLSIKYIAY